jgi:hypothetical protein
VGGTRAVKQNHYRREAAPRTLRGLEMNHSTKQKLLLARHDPDDGPWASPPPTRVDVAL